jgi:two-component system response regulator HydG
MSKPILIVDDEQPMLRILSRWLEDDGYNVVTCSRYEDARQYLRNEIPLVLITDVRLGEYNGLQLAMMLRDRDPQARTIVVSAFDDPTIRDEANKIGAMFLLKPLGRLDFLAVMREAPTINQ